MTRTLHIRCGTDIQDALVLAKIPGDFMAWGDPICAGPVPGDVDEATYRDRRAQFMARHWGFEPEDILGRLTRDAQNLQTLDRYDELVLWFEHDLYDQCILIQLLAKLPPSVLERSRLVCVGSFPGIQRFIGLGQLTPEQLASLRPQASPIGLEHLRVATQALRAWTATDPAQLSTFLDPQHCGPLNFLSEAVRRHLQELPCCETGLGLTDQLVLRAVADGASTAIEVFQAIQQHLDWQPYLGDTMFWAHMHDLSSGTHPALHMTGEFPMQSLALTSFGQALLDRREHLVKRRGIPADSLYRWRGGVEQCTDKGWVYGWNETRTCVDIIKLCDTTD